MRGVLLGLLLLCSCATEKLPRPQLPTEFSMNERAGRGGWLMVTLHLESGEDLPFLVDTGTSDTVIDKSLAPTLGKALGPAIFQSWGVKETNSSYAAPTLYLGGARLVTGDRIFSYDCKQMSSAAGHPVMGILGMDVLKHYCIQLDFAAGKMRFLDAERADKKIWGKAFPIVPLNSRDPRPAVGENLLGAHGPHSLIDSGCDADGWLMPQFFRQWTNQAVPAAKGEARSPAGMFDGEKYPLVSLRAQDVESDGIGIRFLARHLVTLNFPNRTMYLQRQSIGPLPDPRLKTTRMEPLDNLIMAVILEDVASAQSELSKIERSDASQFATSVARKLVATLDDTPKPAPADLPPEVVEVPLGDVHPELAEVGWLKPAANRIPLNGEIESPLLDSGKIYATGLFAHAPSRYVYDLRGQWKTLRGEAGLHTAFQPYAYGIIFVIKTDGKEVFRSSVVRGSELVRYDVDLTGVKTLELIVDQAAEQNGGNWGLWLDPILSR